MNQTPMRVWDHTLDSGPRIMPDSTCQVQHNVLGLAVAWPHADPVQHKGPCHLAHGAPRVSGY